MTPTLNPNLLLWVPLAPLVGCILAGLFGKLIGRRGAHTVTILGVAVAAVLSLLTLQDVLAGARFNATIYEWMVIGGLKMEVGFLVDGLTAMMMVVVTSVSLMVHLYTIGYMADDPGYQRFFSYISLFTFSMLMLVMSNNLLQLFFGWEAVGLVSYLLIGFWFKKPTAIFANMKAFLVNRVGDFGFILGIGLLVAYGGSLNYTELFAKKDMLAQIAFPSPLWGGEWMLITVICICLFIGAMGKSAQFPLHVWLPDSMEGPTPISALIHAATMVTAGIFMVARMSPLFELSDTALNFVLVIGSITALFMGFLGIIQNDIKRVVAYSTLSQLGYMTVALGVSAYSVAVFHLMTHAFFKALLFLAAGSVIIGMHHDQDIRNMGGLRKYMRITWITSLIGSLALIGTPFLSGFYSKDSIIEAVHGSHLPGAGFATLAVTAGVFITAFYSFRMYFLVFHGPERFRHKPFPGEHDHHDDHHGHDAEPHESPWVVWVPLAALAVPSLFVGYFTIGPMVHGDFFADAITVNTAAHGAMLVLKEHFHSAAAMGMHAFTTLPFWLALAGVATAYLFYIVKPEIPAAFARVLRPLIVVGENKYYLDWFNENVLARGARLLGVGLWKGGDTVLIDGLVVNGSAKAVGILAKLGRLAQTGRLTAYALAMIVGIVGLMSWKLWPYIEPQLKTLTGA
ncbi:NADH-quinone oxidoreductase subunit L [Inhella crocodyli]|uniref:NADH-quinone oxidoreductase subunit L n=1 Tax=Inhella crocodyli TaxID=2499851 RepID=A0A3S2UK30_9BURK|nr:NADH-quinone oxidoreductase subunit L [Inhella crocodyli]RVT87970.1 NADH-quinone oxidoreductase subunit L [Inhella crocodyli]